MRALTVDDEQIMLNALTSAVKESPDISVCCTVYILHGNS